MKTLTVSVTDDLYERAIQKAAATAKSLPEVVQGLLDEWTHDGLDEVSESKGSRGDFLSFLEELAARPLMPGPSVGPLHREELYQRGVPGH
jgi:hypothetical protein